MRGAAVNKNFLGADEDWANAENSLANALKERGMVSFAKWFSRDDIEAVRAYVGEQSRVLATEEGARLAKEGSLQK